MNIKIIVALLLVSTMLSSSGGILASPGVTGNSQPIHLQDSPSVFPGNVTVYPNGTISSQSAPILRSGQQYTLTGDINGSLRFEASNAFLNGNSYSILGNNGTNPALLVSNSSGVNAANLTVISHNATAPGLLIVNTSMDHINNINVAAPSVGVLISRSTFDVNVSDTKVSVGGSSSFGMAAVVTGGYIGAGHVITPVSGSRNISLYGNVISNAGGEFGILINSPNSSLRDSTVTMTGKAITSSQPPILILADQINTSVASNVLDATNVSLAVGFGNFSPNNHLYTGEEFNGNTLTIVSPGPNSFVPVSGVESFDSSLTIAGNHIYAKNLLSKSSLLASYFGDVNVSNNTVVIDNSTNVGVLDSEVRNVTMDSNSILYSQNSSLLGDAVISLLSYSSSINDNTIVANNASTGSALIFVQQLTLPGAVNSIDGNHLESTNSSAYGIVFNGTRANISRNILHLNGSEPNGIVISGTDLTVSNNDVKIQSSISSTGIGDSFSNVNFDIHNSNISGNTINITGSASGQIFGMYLINSIEHLGITGNSLYSNDSKFKGIDFSHGSANNLSISRNSIVYSPVLAGIFTGLSVDNVNTLIISGNVILSTGMSGMNPQSYILSVGDSFGISVSNNTLEGANTSVYLASDGNITFYGNNVVNEYTGAILCCRKQCNFLP